MDPKAFPSAQAPSPLLLSQTAGELDSPSVNPFPCGASSEVSILLMTALRGSAQ